MTRKAKIMFLAAVLSAACASCALFERPNAAFVDGVDQYAVRSGLLDEYERYVDADPGLAEQSKEIRKATAAGLRRLIEQAAGGGR